MLLIYNNTKNRLLEVINSLAAFLKFLCNKRTNLTDANQHNIHPIRMRQLRVNTIKWNNLA
jgi:hypothetical protein